ncbi:hypothetical protein WEB32_32525 [Streptomyces netropsis]|uniref:hypothetical protein n=1 Tax=Streptomyces netropsis TaxID=55404 RepID=UPI0030CCA968
MRKAAQFTGAAFIVAVLLTGCGGGGGGGDAQTGDKPSASASAGTSGNGTPAKEGASGSIDGVYAAAPSADGAVGLSISHGRAALYAGGGKRVCTGTVGEGTGPVTLTLTCGDGNTDRTRGKVERSSGKTVVVSWESGKKDTFTRTGAAAELPAPTKLGG